MTAVRGRAKTTPRIAEKMNAEETEYAARLEEMRLAGLVLRFDYQPEKLRLADLTFYTPDFRVLDKHGMVEFHEVKGWWREDARVKIKVAAEMHPYTFRAVRMRRVPKKRGGGWEMEFEEF